MKVAATATKTETERCRKRKSEREENIEILKVSGAMRECASGTTNERQLQLNSFVCTSMACGHISYVINGGQILQTIALYIALKVLFKQVH